MRQALFLGLRSNPRRYDRVLPCDPWQRTHISMELEALLTEESYAGVDNSRVVETALPGLDFVQRGVEAERRPIGAMCQHRVHHVGDRQDLGLDQNGLTFEVVRVARAVEPLVMLQDHLADGPGKVDALYDVITGLRMGLDHLEFERRQLAGLAQELGRDIDLADIVDRRGEEEALDLPFRQADLASNCGREFRHAALVAGGVSVAHLDRGGDRLDGRSQAFLQGRKSGLSPGMIALRANPEGKISGQLFQQIDLLRAEGILFRLNRT